VSDYWPQLLSQSQCLIHTLDLSDNAIGPRGAQDLSSALRISKTITFVNLSNNPIGDVGGKSVSLAIRDCVSLQTLLLKSVEITVAAINVADALRRTTSLTRLDLSSNMIDDAGASAIGRALRSAFVWFFVKPNV
jgi:Ran GTPase-activating protein (RanGAP) involved in mRNA processing and transport